MPSIRIRAGSQVEIGGVPSSAIGLHLQVFGYQDSTVFVTIHCANAGDSIRQHGVRGGETKTYHLVQPQSIVLEASNLYGCEVEYEFIMTRGFWEKVKGLFKRKPR